MSGKSTRHNIRGIHNAPALKLQGPLVLLMVDFEKAFHSVGWDYLFALLHKSNFGINFLKYVRLLYTDLWVRARLGGDISDSFPI